MRIRHSSAEESGNSELQPSLDPLKQTAHRTWDKDTQKQHQKKNIYSNAHHIVTENYSLSITKAHEIVSSVQTVSIYEFR